MADLLAPGWTCERHRAWRWRALIDPRDPWPGLMIIPPPVTPHAEGGWLFLEWGDLVIRDGTGAIRFCVSAEGGTLLLLGGALPETLALELVGRPLADIVELPFAADRGCLIVDVEVTDSAAKLVLIEPLLLDVDLDATDAPDPAHPACDPDGRDPFGSSRDPWGAR